MDYWTYQPAAPQAIALQFDIKYRPSDVAYGGRLVFEPYQQPANGGTVAGGWQHWTDLTSGMWWASKTSAAGSNGICGQATPCSWSTILAAFPNATINGRLLLKAGSGWSANTYNTDAVTIGVNGSSTTYDFEPFIVATDKDSCKNGGWMNLTDINGNKFKNQGDCVSYVATGGKNTASTKTH